MQPLKDYLNESPLQYEGILDPNQNKVMSRLTDELIPNRIREYCTWDYQKYNRGELWPAADTALKITKIDKDEKGWYVDTTGTVYIYVMSSMPAKSFYDYCIAKGQQIDKQKGFLIEDIGIYFRWRKHDGLLEVGCSLYIESTQGLPEELDILSLANCCQKSKKIDIRNKTNVVSLNLVENIKILGKGCKNVIISPEYPCNSIIVPNGVKIHHPESPNEYWDLMDKLSKH